MKKKNTIISDWLNIHNNPEIDEQVNKQLEEKTKMRKEIIIVDKPLQGDNTLEKQCINGEYPNWCVRTEGAKLGETFQEWWKRKQELMGDKILGIYLYDIQPIGGIIGKPNEAALFIRYDYIIVKKQLEEKTKMSKEFITHFIITEDHAYVLVNWEDIESWNNLPFYKKWFIKKPIKELKRLNQNEYES